MTSSQRRPSKTAQAQDAAARPAEIVREYGPFPGADKVDGVSHDGQPRLDRRRRPADRVRSGERRGGAHARRAPATPAPRSTASTSGRSPRRASTRSIPPPATSSPRSPRPAAAATRASPGPRAASGSGSTAIARSTASIPATGAVLRTIESNRFVTGVTWVDGELWHGTWEGDESEIRRIDPDSGAVLDRLEMPPGTGVSGLESDGADLFYAGGGEQRQGPRRAPSQVRPFVIHRSTSIQEQLHHEHRHRRSHQGHHHADRPEPSRRLRRPLGRRAQGAAGAREGARAPARRDRPRAPRAALGARRQGLRLRHARRAGARSPTCSKAGASCWCSTSCSAPAGSRAARAARSWPTTPTA